MKIKILLVYIMLPVVLLQCFSCSKDESTAITELTGSWRVAYFLENGNRITKNDRPTWPDMNNGDITAVFAAPDISGAGNISGITVTNHYNGQYNAFDDGRLEIGGVATTLINEPEWTRLYRLSAAESFVVKNSRLFIYYNDRKSAIVFERN